MEYLKRLSGISGIYFYLLFILSLVMWSYVFYIYIYLKPREKEEIKSCFIQKRFLKKLNTIFFLSAFAPLLGLLGTVDGIIDIFKEICITSNLSSGIMAGGIGKALTTTQMGLIIAIPGFAAGNFIKEKYLLKTHVKKKKGLKLRRSVKDRNLVNDINMTPMLDMVFILLIFFVVTSSFIQNKIIEISIPEASGGKPADEKINYISVNVQGELFWNSSPSDYNELGKIFLNKNSKIEKIIIAPDKNVPSGKLVEVMDFLGKNKITNIAIFVKDNEK